MSDLIDRQDAIDAMRKYEVDIPMYAPRETDIFWNDAIDACCDVVEALPSANLDLDGYSERLWKAAYERGKRDAIPVQCEDCKHYDIFPNGTNGMCKKSNDAWTSFYPWDFCSKGERRNDE